MESLNTGQAVGVCFRRPSGMGSAVYLFCPGVEATHENMNAVLASMSGPPVYVNVAAFTLLLDQYVAAEITYRATA